MNKKQLKKMAENSNHIPEIYNYCDRWCERCAFTTRCLNYAVREENRIDSAASDIESEAFWNKIEEKLKLAMETLQEMITEQGIDLNDANFKEAAREHELTREEAESHELSQRARQYYKLVDAWFKENENIFKQREKDFRTELSIGLEQKKLIDEAKSIVDATEVIGWYQHQIYVKIMRALTYPEINVEFEDEIQNDSNGSAKVALIGIDRSINAWARLHDHFPNLSDKILDILLHLDRLKKKTEKTFPNARDFKRPGFDTM